jgi:hypothetical protein
MIFGLHKVALSKKNYHSNIVIDLQLYTNNDNFTLYNII